jgi:hypothetical protein
VATADTVTVSDTSVAPEAVLLLNMNGTNNSTSFVDSSSRNRTITAGGNAVITTSQIKFGSASGSFNGTSNTFLTVSSSSGSDDFAFGTLPYTIEFWYRRTSSASTTQTILGWGSSTNRHLITFDGLNGDLAWVVGSDGNSAIMQMSIASPGINTNTWYHIACVREGSEHRLYVNGIRKGLQTASYTAIAPTTDVCIGGQSTQRMVGFLDDFRIIKGTALYTGTSTSSANFTPPTSELTTSF